MRDACPTDLQPINGADGIVVKIALVNKVMSRRGGGGERYAVDLAHHLLSFDCQVHAYGQLLEDLPQAVQRHPVTAPARPGFRKITGFIRNVRSALNDQYHDIVYALTQFYPTDIYFMGGGMHEHWMHVRDPNPVMRQLRYLINPTHLVMRRVERQLCRSANCRTVIANSNLVKRHAMVYGGVPGERVQVVHNGVDLNTFNLDVRRQFRTSVRRALGFGDNQIVILFIAHNWRRKGLETLMRALGMILRQVPRYQLVVAGRGRTGAFAKIIQQNKLHDHVRFVGPVDAPQRYYAGSDLMVLPTIYDPCAGVTLEAMACGLPVITTASNGASELIDKQSGFVLENHTDATTLSRYLLHLAEDPLRTAMGQHAARVMQDHSFAKVAQRTYEIMRTMIGK